jgi:hypothetical protein
MSRYFDVDELLENMRRHKQHSVPFEYIKSLTPAHVVPAPRWISVKERLPEAGERVLATDGYFVGEFFLNRRGQWLRYNISDCLLVASLDILHWMPLPEPPKEEGE